MSPKSSRTPSVPEMSDQAEAVKARLKESLLHDKQAMEVDKIFKALVKLEGSDLHLKVGQPPMVRVRGELKADLYLVERRDELMTALARQFF